MNGREETVWALRRLADALEADVDTRATVNIEVTRAGRLTDEVLAEMTEKPWLQITPPGKVRTSLHVGC